MASCQAFVAGGDLFYLALAAQGRLRRDDYVERLMLLNLVEETEDGTIVLSELGVNVLCTTPIDSSRCLDHDLREKPSWWPKAEAMLREGKSYAQVARAVSVSRQRVHEVAKSLGFKRVNVVGQ